MNRQFAALGGVDGAGHVNLFVLDASTGALTEELFGFPQSPNGISPIGLNVFHQTLYPGLVFLFDGIDNEGRFGLWDGHGLRQISVSGAYSLGVFASLHFPGETYDPDITVMKGLADAFVSAGSDATNAYVFAGTDATGQIGLFVSTTEGTPQEVTGIANAFAGGIPSNADNGVSPDFTAVYPTSSNPFFVFNGQDTAGHQQLWVTIGTTSPSGTTLTPSGAHSAGLDPTGFFDFGGEALFEGIDSAGKAALWVTDGTSGGTTEIPVAGANSGGIFFGVGGNFNGDSGPDFTPVNSVLLFRGTDAAGNVGGIWETDGTTTTEVYPGQSGSNQRVFRTRMRGRGTNFCLSEPGY